jgi:GTP-binding protein
MAPLDDSSPADAAEVIVNELTKFSPSLAERDRWLVLNKATRSWKKSTTSASRKSLIAWSGRSGLRDLGHRQARHRALSHDIMRYLEDRADRLANDPAYAEELADLDQRIEDEARAQLQALDDARALRRSGVKSVHDIGDDDWDEFRG